MSVFNHFLFPQPIIQAQEARPSALLGVSVLVHTYCQNVGLETCQSQPEVTEAIVAYERRLNNNCYAMGGEEEDAVVVSLKGAFDL